MKFRPTQILALGFFSFFSAFSAAESLRCKTDIVQIGESKADIFTKCGQPQLTDTFCEKTQRRFLKDDGSAGFVESCENIDVWTYNPGKGQFWTHLYFEKGKLREMKYGDRVE